MVTNFFATTTDDWQDPAGALHAYLVPGGDVGARLSGALDVARGIPFLAAQPADGVHATILRLPTLVRDLSDEDVALIKTEATAAGASVLPVTLEFGAPHLTGDSLLVSAPNDPQWDALVELVKGVQTRVWNTTDSGYPSPWAPHMTIAYAISEGDDDVVLSALSGRTGATSVLGPVTFSRIAWCGVHQNRDSGTYTFDVLFETPLGETLQGSTGV